MILGFIWNSNDKYYNMSVKYTQLLLKNDQSAGEMDWQKPPPPKNSQSVSKI